MDVFPLGAFDGVDGSLSASDTFDVDINTKKHHSRKAGQLVIASTDEDDPALSDKEEDALEAGRLHWPFTYVTSEDDSATSGEVDLRLELVGDEVDS